MEGKFYTYPSDIWSIGIAVYEMVSGTHPYPEVSNPLILHEMIKNQPSPSLFGVHGISNDLADFVQRW